MAQQATLETRETKHDPRTLTEQRAAWHTQAAESLGGPEAVQTMINKALYPSFAPEPGRGRDVGGSHGRPGAGGGGGTAFDLAGWHVRAEAERHVRAADIPTDKLDQLVELLVGC